MADGTQEYDMGAMLRADMLDDARIAILKDALADLKSKIDAIDGAREERRERIAELMEANGVTSDKTPFGTVSVVRVAPKAEVIDEAALPEDLLRVKTAPDMKAIKARLDKGEPVAGARLSNGSITVRVLR